MSSSFPVVPRHCSWHRKDNTSLVLSNHIQQAFTYGLIDSKLTDRVKVTKVVVPPDLAALFVYWSPASVEDNIAELDYLLEKNSYVTSQYLQKCRIIGKIPPVLFMQEFPKEQSSENIKNDADGLPEALNSDVDRIVSRKLEKLEIESESSAKKNWKYLLDTNKITNFKLLQENSFKSCDNNKFLDHQDICNESLLVKKNRTRDKDIVKNPEELDHESLMKKIVTEKRKLTLKEKLQLDVFHPPLILSKKACLLAVEEYSRRAAVSSKLNAAGRRNKRDSRALIKKTFKF